MLFAIWSCWMALRNHQILQPFHGLRVRAARPPDLVALVPKLGTSVGTTARVRAERAPASRLGRAISYAGACRSDRVLRLTTSSRGRKLWRCCQRERGRRLTTPARRRRRTHTRPCCKRFLARSRNPHNSRSARHTGRNSTKRLALPSPALPGRPLDGPQAQPCRLQSLWSRHCDDHVRDMQTRWAPSATRAPLRAEIAW